MDNKEEKDELVTIDYYDRIHHKWIKLDVNKEVAKYFTNSEKQFKRKQAQYNYYNKSFDKVFSNPTNEKYLHDETSDIDYLLNKEINDIKYNIKIEQYKVIIQNALCELTLSQREVIEMVIYNNLSYQQIANKLNISKSSVYKKIKASLEKIKKYIKNTQN